jgi:hypothetical protein
MDARDRVEAEIPWRFDRPEIALLHALQNVVGPRGHFEARHQLPIHQFTTAVVQVVIVRVDRQHFLFSAG